MLGGMIVEIAAGALKLGGLNERYRDFATPSMAPEASGPRDAFGARASERHHSI